MAIATAGTAALSGSGTTETTTSIAVTAPAGIVLGEWINIGISGSANTGTGIQNWTPPAGWTVIKEQTGGVSMGAYGKIATATEVGASSFTFTHATGSGYWSATAQRFSGVDATTPLDGVTPVSATGTTTTPVVLPAFTTSATTSYPVALVMVDDTGPTVKTPPSTWSAITSTTNTANEFQAQFTTTQRTTIPASTWSWTASYTGAGQVAIGFSLRAAAASSTIAGRRSDNWTARMRASNW